MKKKWLVIRAAVSLCAALGWWGVLYPELSLTPDTVKVSGVDGRGKPSELPGEWDFDGGLYAGLLKAGRNKIKFRSRLWEEIHMVWEALHDRDDVK